MLIVVTRAAAAAIDVQLPAHTAIAAPGQSLAIPVSIAPIATGDMVFAGAVSFTYAAAVATATGATPTAALAGCTTTTNLTSGRVTLIFACTAPLASGGALFDVAFQGVAIGVSPLVFAATNEIPNGCLLNEGTPTCRTTGGELVVGAPPPTATATATTSAVATATASATGSPPPTSTATPSGGVPASGQLVQNLFRASDGTAYQLARVLPQPGPAEAVRVTTVAGSVAAVGGCAAAGATAGSGAAAVAGPEVPLPLSPYASVLRTAILLPADAATVTFDAAASGRLRVGSGPGAATVCAAAFDCVGQADVAPLVDLSSSLGGVGASCVATEVGAACDGAARRDAFAFAIAAAGSPPLCGDAPTTDARICAAEPSEGFRLVSGQAIVFIYRDDLASSGFAVGLAGFAIDLDGANAAGCAAGEVVGAIALTTSQPAPPVPTATGTVTVPVPTSTRAPIPIVPSPFAGAGLVMIGGLALALVLRMRAHG